MRDKIRQLLNDIQSGSFKALARGITIVENELDGYDDILVQLHHTNAAKVVGLTGPPGAGKSTLVNALLRHWVSQDKRVAVIAVDPSSPFNYGALLGDRIRMSEFYSHPGVYIRSLATRGVLGGLNGRILEITDLVKNCPFDYIIVETVGVGQSEVEIAGLADCTIVALVPEAGDEVQTLKAGIMEIADIFVVNKADRDAADSLYRNLRVLVHERAGEGAELPVIKTIATENQGVTSLSDAIDACLSQKNTISEKQLHLLTEKAWQLILRSRMKDLKKFQLEQELAEQLRKDSSFNLYAFVRQYA